MNPTAEIDYARRFVYRMGPVEICVSVVTRDAEGEECETNNYQVVQAIQAVLAGRTAEIFQPSPLPPVREKGVQP